MLDLPAIQAVLARVTFMPGWALTAWQHPHEGIWVSVVAEVDDSYHPGEPLMLGVNSALPPIRDEEQLLEWLCWRLEIVWVHEVREWLRLDGRTVFDPHAAGVNDPPRAQRATPEELERVAAAFAAPPYPERREPRRPRAGLSVLDGMMSRGRP